MTSPNENYTSWTVGMRVVCVDASPINRDLEGRPIKPVSTLQEGNVYTIADIGVRDGIYHGRGRFVKIRLVNVLDVNDGYAAARFRPVQTRKTDISIFQRILSNPHKKIHKVEA